jgi:hypothetical protein
VLTFSYCAPLAQLDRASGYEPEGREFESLRAHHSSPLVERQRYKTVARSPRPQEWYIWPKLVPQGLACLKAMQCREHLLCTLRTGMLYFLLSALMWLPAVSAQQSTSSKPFVRPCADSWNEPESGTKRSRSKDAKRVLKKQAGACIELTFSALEIQEYLQSHARKERWKITADRLNEDSWTFSLDLAKDELLGDTSPDSAPKTVDWKAGSARVNVSTSELADGFTRTIVRASFRGYGRNQDQFAMQKEYWDLESNNSFESSITSALRNYFTAAAAAGNP